jgi:hypothetical protein
MPYTLITKNGKIMQFYVQGAAETYKNLYGGVVFTQQILTETAAQAVGQ